MKINDVIQNEMLKKQGNISMNTMEKQWTEQFDLENKGKSIKRISKILKKIQNTDKLSEKQKRLLDAKFDEFIKFSKGECDY